MRTTILITQVNFVPDDQLASWVATLPWSTEMPVVSFVLGAFFSAADLVWLGVVHHGPFGIQAGERKAMDPSYRSLEVVQLGMMDENWPALFFAQPTVVLQLGNSRRSNSAILVPPAVTLV